MPKISEQTDGLLLPADTILTVRSGANYEVPATLFTDAVFNVRNYGALGDGTTSDDTAIDAALVACHSAGGGVVYFPPGTYAITGANGILLKASNVVLRGAGMRASVLKKLTNAGPLFQSSGSFIRSNMAFEDLGFDLSGDLGNGFTVSGSHVQNAPLRWSRCRFWYGDTSANKVGINLSGCAYVTVEDSVFHSAGRGSGMGVSVANGIHHLTVQRNRFLYVRNGVSLDTGGADATNEAISEHINILNNHFDLGWWLLRAQASGSGATVSYAATTVTDSGASFATFVTPYLTNVRAMPLLESGTGDYAVDGSLTDASATFVTNLVKRGHIVRSGTTWGVVRNVQSETKLWVEQWLSTTDYQPVAAPTDGAAYSVYGVYIGLVASNTGTAITVDRWHDLDGTSVTPTAQTLYEVLYQRTNYAISMEWGARYIKVMGNTLLRGWSDQVSVYGRDAIIANNVIMDGEDLGITLHGQSNVVQGNRIHHQGTGGMYVTSDDSLIVDNVVTDSQWVNNINNVWLADITVYDGSRNRIANNHCSHDTTTQNHYGIVIYSGNVGTSDANVVEHNTCLNHVDAGVRVDSSATGTTNTVLRSNDLSSDEVGWVDVDDQGIDTVNVGDSIAGLASTPTATPGSGDTILAIDSSAANAVSRFTLLNVRGQVYNVKDYGAVGDGTTVDTTAIHAARDAAGTGGIVYFPPGTYLGNTSTAFTPLTNQTWIGAGRKLSYLKANSGWTQAVVQAANDGTQLRDLGILGNSVAQHGVDINSATDVIIEHCYFDNTSSWAIICRLFSNRAKIMHNLIDGSRTGAGAGNTIEINKSDYVTVEGNTLLGAGNNFIEIYQNATSTPLYGIRIINNHVELVNTSHASANGMLIMGAQNALVQGNTVLGVPGVGILVTPGEQDTSVQSTGVKIIGNLLNNNGGTTNAGIDFRAITENSIIADNEVNDSGNAGIVVNGCFGIAITGNVCTLNQREGIRLNNGGNHAATGNICANNSKAGAGTYYGINLATTDYNVVTGNRCYDRQVTQTQQGGIVISSGSDNNVITGNHTTGNLSTGLVDSGATNTKTGNV
jgi:hypothetical protein